MTETYVEDSRDPDRDDGEQTPTALDLPDEEGDAGVGDVELEEI
jgi:hypothetical protein